LQAGGLLGGVGFGLPDFESRPPAIDARFQRGVDFDFHFVLDGRVDAAERRIEIGVDG